MLKVAWAERLPLGIIVTVDRVGLEWSSAFVLGAGVEGVTSQIGGRGDGACFGYHGGRSICERQAIRVPFPAEALRVEPFGYAVGAIDQVC